MLTWSRKGSGTFLKLADLIMFSDQPTCSRIPLQDLHQEIVEPLWIGGAFIRNSLYSLDRVALVEECGAVQCGIRYRDVVENIVCLAMRGQIERFGTNGKSQYVHVRSQVVGKVVAGQGPESRVLRRPVSRRGWTYVLEL